MKKLTLSLFFFLICQPLFAQDEVLKIGTESFAPPFATIGAGGHIYGFDADMMQILCKNMNRKCEFQSMLFNQLIPSAAAGDIDMAVSAIAITIDRLKVVNFSNPYLIINPRILTKTSIAQQPFSLSAFENKRIGYETGSILGERVMDLGIKNPKMRAYKHIEDMVVALSNGDVDFIVLDNPTALYWQNNASGDLSTFGDPLPYDIMIGIALNPQKPELVAAVNAALQDFLNKGGFHQTYNKYLAPFANPKNLVKTNP